MTFDADGESRANLVGLLSAKSNGVPVPFPHPWRDTDNITRSLAQEQLVMLAAAMFAAMSALYNKSWELKDVTIPGLTDAQVGTFDVTADEH